MGFNAYVLRTSEKPWFAAGLEIVKTGDDYLVAGTQQHHLMENRDLVRAGTLGEFHDQPDFAGEPERRQRAENAARLNRAADAVREYSIIRLPSTNGAWRLI